MPLRAAPPMVTTRPAAPTTATRRTTTPGGATGLSNGLSNAMRASTMATLTAEEQAALSRVARFRSWRDTWCGHRRGWPGRPRAQ
jgi:hypothetical protein